MKYIIISGTPGTGKTTISNNLCKFINANVISLNKLVIEERYILEYDTERETSVVDEKRLLNNLYSIIKEFDRNSMDYLIIEGHFSEIIPKDYIDYVIILRCDPDELYARLYKRGYKKGKIIENVQSEILGNCVSYFIEKKLNLPLYEIDTTKCNIEDVSKVILDIISEKKDMSYFYVGKIDWLEKLSNQDRINEFFE